jgi:hypothetical protein
MGFEALGKIASYLGFPAVIEETTTKKAMDAVTPLAQSVLAKSPQDSSFFYCVLPPGSTQVSKLMCSEQEFALQGFNELVARCQAIISESICATPPNAQPYGQCGNRAICNLFYNGVINSCFDKALNATVPFFSCTTNPTTTPAVVGTSPWLVTGLVLGSVVVCSIGLVATVCAVKYRTQIAEVWNRCCMRCSYQKLNDASEQL